MWVRLEALDLEVYWYLWDLFPPPLSGARATRCGRERRRERKA